MLAEILTLEHLLMAALGVVVGIVFGAIPGMTATMAVAVFLPLTYAYDLMTSLFLLLGLYVGGISGGLIPAILINIPGTPSSITTCFDGHPMAMRGEGERALKIGITASLLGGLISLMCLALFTPPLAKLAIKFSAVEKFLVILFAMTIISALSKGKMLVGIFMGFLGVLVSLMGTFDDNNKLRLVPHALRKPLIYGFALLPVLIGLFALGQMFEEAEKGMQKNDINDAVLKQNKVKFRFSDFKNNYINIIRSSLLGHHGQAHGQEHAQSGLFPDGERPEPGGRGRGGGRGRRARGQPGNRQNVRRGADHAPQQPARQGGDAW